MYGGSVSIEPYDCEYVESLQLRARISSSLPCCAGSRSPRRPGISALRASRTGFAHRTATAVAGLPGRGSAQMERVDSICRVQRCVLHVSDVLFIWALCLAGIDAKGSREIPTRSNGATGAAIPRIRLN